MDIFRNIRNDTFGYGGITAKRPKHQERPQLMICSFTNCWYPGTFIYPDYWTAQLLYLWDKKVRLSITNAIKCPSLTKNKRAVIYNIQSLVKIVWEMNLDTFWEQFIYKNKFRHQQLFLVPQFWCWKRKFLDWFLVANLIKKHKNQFVFRISENLRT